MADSNSSNTIDAFSAFSASVDPQTQFTAARNIEQSVIQQRDISSQVATKAAQDVAQQTAEQQNQQMREQNAAKAEAAQFAAKIGPDQLMGHLAQAQAEATELALQQRKQYDKLNAISFFDNPINYLIAQPQKDQIAEQVNSAESTAEFAQHSIGQINTLKSQHMKTALETADVLSTDAMMRQEHINMLTAQQKIAEASSKLGTERLTDIGLLQRGATEQIQINNAKADQIRASARFAMDKERQDEWISEKGLREADRQNRIAQLELDKQRIEFMKEKWPIEKAAAELKYKTEEEKQVGIHIENTLLNNGTKLLGLPIISSIEDAKHTYSEPQIAIIKMVAARSADLTAQNNAKGIAGEQLWYGDNPGDVYKNIALTGASFKGKPQQKIVDYLHSLYGQGSEELAKSGKASGMNATDKEAYRLRYISNHANDTIKLLNSDAENKNVRNLFSDTTIDAVIKSNQQLTNDPIAKLVFGTMVAGNVNNQRTEFEPILGQVKALIAEKKLSLADAARVVPMFYKSLAAYNNTLLQFSTFGMGYQEGYKIKLGSDSLDVSNPTQFTTAFSKSMFPDTFTPWD
jgi:hypothetical protein